VTVLLCSKAASASSVGIARNFAALPMGTVCLRAILHVKIPRHPPWAGCAVDRLCARFCALQQPWRRRIFARRRGRVLPATLVRQRRRKGDREC